MTKPEGRAGGHKFCILMDPAIWRLLEQLQEVINEKLKAGKRRPVSLTQVIGHVLTQALIEQAADIQDEYASLGLHRLAVQLAPLLRADELATAGLPAVPDRPGARRPSRNARIF